MERHKCKLCSRTFSNGRALGGHMKAHLATLPPKPQPLSHSFSSNSSSSEEATHDDEKAVIYGLRENPKKCFRLADPEFDTGSIVVQDRESETESKNPTATRRRSKRARRPVNSEAKRPKLSFMESPVSSVSDTSPEEDVAMCLMMLSRDHRWSKDDRDDNIINVVVNDVDVEEEIKLRRTRVRGKQQCDSCGKRFRSSRALGSHRSICENSGNDNSKIFECPFCSKVFGSGQALGGHKRSHLIMPSNSSSTTTTRILFKETTFIDLNLPAPAEDDDQLSVLSHV